MQGLVYRPDDPRFAGVADSETFRHRVAEDRSLRLANRNAGSGTRLLIDRFLEGLRPGGYEMPYRSHNAVAAAVQQGRADWGVAIEPVARLYGLGFVPLKQEAFDFVVPIRRWDRPPVVAFRELLVREEIQRRLAEMGFPPRCHASVPLT